MAKFVKKTATQEVDSDGTSEHSAKMRELPEPKH